VCPRELDDAVPALWRTDDAPDGRKVLLGEVSRRHAVGGDHEVLDDLRRAVLPFDVETADVVALEDGPGLDCLQAQRSVDVSEVFQSLRDLVLHAHVVGESLDG
jgi:hypothetical protein